MAMLAAMAYLIMVIGRIPVVMFLKYDPKDVVIAISGFLLGPVQALLITVVVALIEMLTVSDTGFIGFFMNVLSTAAFVCPAAWLYRRKHTLRGAVVGLTVGVLAMVAAMIAWNYLVTPYYMGYPRQAVVELLLPMFLPFNLGKGALNAAFTMLLYKPVVGGLKKAKLLPPDNAQHPARRRNIYVTLLCVFVALTAILCFYVLGHS